VPCYVDMVHLERAREALHAASQIIERYADPQAVEVLGTNELIRMALEDMSHADDDIKQPLPPYVPLDERAAQAAQATPDTTPKEG